MKLFTPFTLVVITLACTTDAFFQDVDICGELEDAWSEIAKEIDAYLPGAEKEAGKVCAAAGKELSKVGIFWRDHKKQKFKSYLY